ncbi:hypothetical protein E3V39_11820 [Gammaproteobacteria bacterium LSUCC0112]|nr:hypothetical protein E3V39_11820 [Gammaproteobacteria bacterium LSUCC0112]
MPKWIKRGLIYQPPFDGSWRDNSGLTPTPLEIDDETIRVYASFRDENGVGRIGFIDVDSECPHKVKGVSEKPVLDIGAPGMFDDNGIILGDLINLGNEIFMYFVGFQLVKNAKFLAYSGLACSQDGGCSFQRVTEVPIMDRHDEGRYIRAIHSIMYESGKFKAWYAVGNGWMPINGTLYPKYDINYAESSDGISFTKGIKVISNNNANKEYRIGRPRVYKLGDVYVMNFTYGTTDGRYHAGQATSIDGINWERNDSLLGIRVSDSGWDSRHLSYPSVIKTRKGKTFMFYNGNDMGKNGFGYAYLDEVQA